MQLISSNTVVVQHQHFWVRFNSIGPPFQPAPDQDNDGIPDSLDNCPLAVNVQQLDQDLDGIGDNCDNYSDNTFIVLDSEPGGYIGSGIKQTLLLKGGNFQINSGSQGNPITINYTGTDNWRLIFVAPNNETLAEGQYENATRYPFQEQTDPGFSIGGAGRGCNRLTGRFDVLEINFSPDGEIDRLSIDFKQHCEGREPALFGSVRYNATRDIGFSAHPIPSLSSSNSLVLILTIIFFGCFILRYIQPS